MRRPFLLLFLFLLGTAGAQTLPFDLRDAGEHYAERCRDCLLALQQKPKEVQFGLQADDNGDVYFVITDKRFFDVLFRKAGDGVAVDVVPRSLYGCDKETPTPTGYFKGRVLEPTYLAALKKNRVEAPSGAIVMKVGRLPADLRKDVELNLVLLKDRYVCYYNSFYNLQAYRWDLLNMGLFLDSMMYRDAVDTTRLDSTTRFRYERALHFTIPFAKNRSEYSAADLAPLSDSLRLTDFTIKGIDIHAYSSVEGPEARNIELQEKRAASIVKALAQYQSPDVVTNVKASENWVEFLEDIGTGRHSDLADLPKAEVKERLQQRALAEELEPMLARHRKALVTLYLEKNTAYNTVKQEQLVRDLQAAIADNDQKRAMEVQAAMFQRIEDHDAPASLLDQAEIPRKKEFALLLDQRAGFRYFTDPSDAFATYRELQELDKLLPGDKHIKYNLCAVMFRVWIAGQQAIDPVDLLREINALRGYGIEQPLVKRMLVNHRIIMAELHMRQGLYDEKDKDLKFVVQNYKFLPLRDADLLSLAQYFASYGNYEEARKLIEPTLTRIDVSRDLLFYYLNLTITDEATTRKPAYRKVMLNAINSDRRRFCNLFEPFGLGITFQLLENPYLKKTYCENCY